MYPYRWSIEQPEDPAPKNRTACAILEYGDSHHPLILLVAISDKPSPDAIAMSQADIKQSGLSDFRKAYIHLGHYNLDRKYNSFSYNPRQKPVGRLPKHLIIKIAAKLLDNIQSQRTVKITRD
jgi:hypothetical protein